MTKVFIVLVNGYTYREYKEAEYEIEAANMEEAEDLAAQYFEDDYYAECEQAIATLQEELD